jgi:hypothetical protein
MGTGTLGSAMARTRNESEDVAHDSSERDASQERGTPRPRKRDTLSLYPLNLEDALGAAVATGPIPREDRKPKPKRKAK